MRLAKRRRRAALAEAADHASFAGALHPKDFDRLFAAAGLDEDQAPLVLAVSGGSDSTAMMHAVAAWSRRRARPTPLVATVDHGLRPEARHEAEQVAGAAAALGLPHAILTWRPGPERRSQAEAREARYALLTGYAKDQGAGRLLTAHTLDDQAETFLIRLAKGSGPSGLAAMRMHVDRGGIRHTRPFLGLPKQRLVATCRANGWATIDDPSNDDVRFDRPRWRRLAPLLEEEGLTAARLAQVAARLGRAEDALERATDRAEELCVQLTARNSPPRHPESLAGNGKLSRRHAEERLNGASRSTHDCGASFETAALRPPQDEEVGSFGLGSQHDAWRVSRLGLDPQDHAFSDVHIDPVVSTVDWRRLAAEPEEIALRVLGRALARACGTTRPRLERVEAALADLAAAVIAGTPLRRTLAGCLLDLDDAGHLTVSPEPERRRGR